MSTLKEQKQTLRVKLLAMQKKSLVEYGKYLDSQLKYASKSESRKAYRKYIETQIVQNDTRIKKVEAKIKSR